MIYVDPHSLSIYRKQTLSKLEGSIPDFTPEDRKQASCWEDPSTVFSWRGCYYLLRSPSIPNSTFRWSSQHRLCWEHLPEALQRNPYKPSVPGRRDTPGLSDHQKPGRCVYPFRLTSTFPCFLRGKETCNNVFSVFLKSFNIICPRLQQRNPIAEASSLSHPTYNIK